MTPGFVLGADYEVGYSTDLHGWNRLRRADYRLDETIIGGASCVELRLTTDHGPRVFLQLRQP